MLLSGERVSSADDSRAGSWAVRLLADLGAATDSSAKQPSLVLDRVNEGSIEHEWAVSGLLALGAPMHRPSLVSCVDVMTAARGAVVALRALLGEAALDVDAGTLLTERAVLHGFQATPGRSVGGGARWLRAADGWVVLGLRRPEDVELVAALVGRAGASTFEDVEVWLNNQPAAKAVARAQLLGLPAAQPGSVADAESRQPWTITPAGSLPERRRPLIVDLSSLWAGPLATGLLAEAGHRVVKLESAQRPDGARSGAPAFFERLNWAKRSIALDPSDPMLRKVLDMASVVVTSARSRALHQLGWLPRPGQSWVTVTGHGWNGSRRDWVGYGDDAAVAGGLVAGTAEAPQFCGDAIADPLTGLYAAVAIAASLRTGVAAHVDLALARVSAHASRLLSGPRPAVAETAAPARARPRPIRRAPLFGTDADAIRSWL